MYLIFQINDDKWRQTVIEMRTGNPSRLPIRDVATYASNAEHQEFGIELGLVCFV
jgi:hypothetical protein